MSPSILEGVMLFSAFFSAVEGLSMLEERMSILWSLLAAVFSSEFALEFFLSLRKSSFLVI